MVNMNLACCGLKPNAYCGETKLMHHARSAGVISAKKLKLGIVNENQVNLIRIIAVHV